MEEGKRKESLSLNDTGGNDEYFKLYRRKKYNR